MLGPFRWIMMVALGLIAIFLFVGCTEREHRKVTVHEEQHEGEVESVSPGEMIVE